MLRHLLKKATLRQPLSAYRYNPIYPTFTLQKVRRKTELSTDEVRSTVYEQTTECTWNPSATTTKPDRPQHVRPSPCVIAQHYSSTTFASWGFFFPRKENFSVRFKKAIISIFHFFFLKSRTSEIALSRGVLALPSSFAFTLQLKEKPPPHCRNVTKLNSVALVRERTIPTEWPPPVGEVSANFCG